MWQASFFHSKFYTKKEIKIDCDSDTLLFKVIPEGPVCQSGADTCFNEKNECADQFLFQLEKIINDRKNNPSDGSYTSSLFAKGINKIAQKVGEEAVELDIEAKDNNDDLFLYEVADLLYHLQVLISFKKLSIADVINVLKKRKG